MVCRHHSRFVIRRQGEIDWDCISALAEQFIIRLPQKFRDAYRWSSQKKKATLVRVWRSKAHNFGERITTPHEFIWRYATQDWPRSRVFILLRRHSFPLRLSRINVPRPPRDSFRDALQDRERGPLPV